MTSLAKKEKEGEEAESRRKRGEERRTGKERSSIGDKRESRKEEGRRGKRAEGRGRGPNKGDEIEGKSDQEEREKEKQAPRQVRDTQASKETAILFSCLTACSFYVLSVQWYTETLAFVAEEHHS